LFKIWKKFKPKEVQIKKCTKFEKVHNFFLKKVKKKATGKTMKSGGKKPAKLEKTAKKEK
jgi:hypothetical protein